MNPIITNLKIIFTTSFLILLPLPMNSTIHPLHHLLFHLSFLEEIWIICLPSDVNHLKDQISAQVQSFLQHQIHIKELIECKKSIVSHFCRHFLKILLTKSCLNHQLLSFLKYFFQLYTSFKYTNFLFSFICRLCQWVTWRVNLNQFHYIHFYFNDI